MNANEKWAKFADEMRDAVTGNDDNRHAIAEKIVKLSDSIKIIYTSGYSEESINGEKIVFDEAKFLQKPFTIKMLAEKVKNILTSA